MKHVGGDAHSEGHPEPVSLGQSWFIIPVVLPYSPNGHTLPDCSASLGSWKYGSRTWGIKTLIWEDRPNYSILEQMIA